MKTIARMALNSLLVVMFLLLPLRAAAAQAPLPSGSQPAQVVGTGASLTALFNTNLLPNGDAENGSGTTHPGWVDNEGFTQILPYGQDCGGNCFYPSPYDPGPVLRGNNFFYMGSTDNHTNGTNMWIQNKISLASIQVLVNTGKLRYILSGYFGGAQSQTDSAQLHMFFETGSGSSTGEATIGNVTQAERQNKTGLLYRQQTGTIPKGTVNINLVLQSGTLSGSHWRTGFADNLSLVLLPAQVYLPAAFNGQGSQPPPQTGFPAPTGVFVTPNGLTRMDIYWTDNSNNETGFEVQRINADASIDTICNTKPNVTYCFDPGFSQSLPYGYVYLGSNVTYTYQVRAVGAGINSTWASRTGATATEPISPPSPTHGSFTCQAIDVTSTSATFVWNNPFNYEAGFNLYLNGSSSPFRSMIENGTKISFINQNSPNSITLKIVPFVYIPADPTHVNESTTSCTATANLPGNPPGGITYFNNDASYPVISLVIDGWEQFAVRPLGIISGAYYELDGVPAGQHSWTAVTGFWDDWGQRFSMYNYTGTYNQPASGEYTIHIPDMAIQDLLSVPPANLGYWEGYYYDAYANCYTTAFKFQQNGTFTFYNANSPIDSGTYSLVQHEPDIFSTKFHVTSSKQNVDGLLIETHGQFFMKNGPPSWPQITYVFKPQGNVRNPFCP